MDQKPQEEVDEEQQLENEIKNISALSIQLVWKKYKTLRAIHQTVKSKREPVVVYYSSIATNQKIRSDQMQLFHMLKVKNIKFFKFDLVDNKMAQGWVKEILNRYQLPFVTINNVFVGGYEEFQILYELDLLIRIIKKDYEKECILCDEPKVGDECPNCNKPYDFFKKD
ncbi:unnamed protein product [Paramecium sonneborni]|uniref:Glutaredoxin domain-containing protein n=1 Tax=Paramecium sonneborni TaxID=65129 RepID=A0A8S1LXV9_9CILI|nr:unnamed protein product [Paramecium sonneborni]